VALPSPATDSAPTLQTLLDRFPSVGQFSGKDDFTGRVVHDRYACGLAARVNLDAQWLNDWRLYRTVQDDGEGIASKHRCFPVREQHPRPARMHWIQGVFIRIEDKHFAHHEPPIARVMVALSMLLEGLT
jgi:hypothetical protein